MEYEFWKNYEESTFVIGFKPKEENGCRYLEIYAIDFPLDGDDFPPMMIFGLPLDLYQGFKEALAKVEVAMIEQGWLSEEDLEPKG